MNLIWDREEGIYRDPQTAKKYQLSPDGAEFWEVY